MLTGISKSIFRTSRILALGVVLFVVFLLAFTEPLHAFQLDSEKLIGKRDYFSTLKKQKKYNEINELISLCKERRDKKCLGAAQMVYIDPQFIFFRNLVAELSVRFVVSKGLPLSKLSFLNKDELRSPEISKILKKYDVATIDKFFNENFLIQSLAVKDIFLKNTNLLCKFSSKEKFTDLMLTSIVASDDLYEKDFSSFPCSLNLKGRMDLLASEIKTARTRKAHSHDYYFKFLEKRVSRTAFRNFPMYRKRKLSYRKKKIWKALFKVRPFIQTRVAENLFYKGEYELLAHISEFPELKIKALSFEALEYSAKSLMALGEYEKIIKVSSHVEPAAVESVEEIFLMRGGAFLRLGKFKKAESAYRSLLANFVDLRLSGLYWLRTSLKIQKKKTLAVDEQILSLYPFSYYGILVARERQGVAFFDKYKKRNKLKESFSNLLGPGEIERLKFYYTYGRRVYFKKTFKSFEGRLSPVQKALFSLVFRNLEDQLEVIRSFNLIWDLDPQVRMEPFISASFPQPYKEVLTKSVKNLDYVNAATAYAVMRQESAFGAAAKSPSGARGLMQLLPTTAKDVSRQIRYKKYRKSGDLYKPAINIHLGSRYLNRLVRAGKGYLPYAFASYNAGPGRMYKWSKYRSEITDLRQGFKKETANPIDELWIEELPWSETRFYTKALLRNMGIYLALEGKQNKFSCSPYWACPEKKL